MNDVTNKHTARKRKHQMASNQTESRHDQRNLEMRGGPVQANFGRENLDDRTWKG